MKSSKVLVFLFLFSPYISFAEPQDAEEALPDGDEIVSLNTSIFGDIYLDDTHEKVVIFQQVGDSSQLFVQPYLYVDIEDLKLQQIAKCSQVDQTEKQKFQLKFQTYNPTRSNKIEAKFKERYPTHLFNAIHPWPYLYLELTALYFENLDNKLPKEKFISYFPDVANEENLYENAVSNTHASSFLSSRLVLSCNLLDKIIEKNTFQLKVVSPTQLTESARIEAIFNGILNSSEILDLIRSEKQDGSLKTTSNSISNTGAIAFSLDKFGGGASTTDANITNEMMDSRKRLVNSYAINEAVKSAFSNLSIQQYGDISDASMKPTDVIKYVQEQIKHFSVFTTIPIKDNVLILNEQKRALLNDERVSLNNTGSLISKATFNSEGTATIPLNGQPVTIEKKDNGDVSVTDGRGITFSQNDGGTWIPSSLEMHVITKDNLSLLTRIAYKKVTAKGGRYLQQWIITNRKTPPNPAYVDITLDDFKKNFTKEVTQAINTNTSKLDAILNSINQNRPHLILTDTLIKDPLAKKNPQHYANVNCSNYPGYSLAFSYTIEEQDIVGSVFKSISCK